MSRRVMLYVQHLLGVGHLRRASLIARALRREGFDVTVAQGGPESFAAAFDGCSRILLPPVHAADAQFETLLDEQGLPIDDAWRDRRAHRLTSEFEAFAPDVLILELFPFGRAKFAFELMPLLRSARAAEPRPLIVSSVRDALVRKSNPERNREMVRLARIWFDAVLVHGDRAFFPLSATFPETAEIEERLTYTGYVAGDDPPSQSLPSKAGKDEVIVSAGGGAVGEKLLRAAIAARPKSALRDRVWRLITGPNLPADIARELIADAPDGVVIDRWRTDMPTLLRNCALSISQAGYNTVVDVMASRARAVVAPFETGSETEQAFRARAFAERGLLVAVDWAALGPETLADAADRAFAGPRPTSFPDLDGARRSAQVIAQLAGGE